MGVLVASLIIAHRQPLHGPRLDTATEWASPQIPRRPYLVRAMHEWMTANNQTPHLVVDAASPAAEVPRAYVRDGRITLNVSWQATQGLKLGNEWIEFSARFGGVATTW